jgi:hypothetical protein
MAGSLSVATTAVSSARVAVADSGEVGRSAGIIMCTLLAPFGFGKWRKSTRILGGCEDTV